MSHTAVIHDLQSGPASLNCDLPAVHTSLSSSYLINYSDLPAVHTSVNRNLPAAHTCTSFSHDLPVVQTLLGHGLHVPAVHTLLSHDLPAVHT